MQAPATGGGFCWWPTIAEMNQPLSERPARCATLPEHGQFDVSEAVGSDRLGASRRQVDEPARDERSPVVDADDHGSAGPGVGDLDEGAEGQGAVGRRVGGCVGGTRRWRFFRCCTRMQFRTQHELETKQNTI